MSNGRKGRRLSAELLTLSPQDRVREGDGLLFG